MIGDSHLHFKFTLASHPVPCPQSKIKNLKSKITIASYPVPSPQSKIENLKSKFLLLPSAVFD